MNADNIKDIVKVLIWAQKELLYSICNIESNIIYTLYNTLGESQMNNLKEDENYFNFFKLIETYNQNIEKIKSNENFENKKKFDDKSLVELLIIRNMLAHGRLIDKYYLNETKDKHEDINYLSIISILDISLQNIFNKNLADSYADKNGNKSYENRERKKDYKNNNKFNNKNKNRRKNI